MGRQQYLTRLALGRSAFEPVDGIIDPQPVQDDFENEAHVQQYDAKGQPMNPQIDAFKADMRKAQNDVLALVGVVERKDLSDRHEERRNRAIRERRTRLLADEHEKGELLDYAFLPVTYLSHMWTDAFIQRIQIDFYDSSRSMADILSSKWRAIFSGGVKDALASLFPGYGELVIHTLIRLPLIVGVEQLTGRIQSYVQKRRFKRKTSKRLYTTISILFEVALLAIDVALLPMEFHAHAQRLGLAPQLPLFPPWKSFLPWHPTSFQQFGWKPLYGFVLFKSLTSPAILLLLHKIFHWDGDENEIPICGLFTSFRYPAIDQHPDFTSKPKLLRDPTGWLMHQTYTLRTSIMRWCGWDIYRITADSSGNLENNTRERYLHDFDDNPPIHRSTALAHLPALRLAATIDTFLARILTLPFESLMLRSIAQAFMLYSPTPKTVAAREASGRIFRPAQLSSSSSTGLYISRLGLALALDASVDVLLFFGVYASSRHVGRKFFDWRSQADSDPEPFRDRWDIFD